MSKKNIKTITTDIPKQTTDMEFVKEVQRELTNNCMDIPRMKKAYSIITGGEMGNVRVMKLTILNHTQWTE